MFSFNQQIALAVIPKVTASFSIAALIYAIKKSTFSRNRWKVLCNRLFVGMFMCDLLRCLTYVAGTWMIPSGTEGVFMATGNQATCATQAFLSQLGVSVPLYVVSFGIYFLNAIKHDFNSRKIRWMEKWCHIVPNFISLSFAVVLVSFNQYGVGDARCWITPGNHFFLLFEKVFSLVSIVITMALFVTAFFIEATKRKNSNNLRGKRKFLEKARQTKSSFVLKQFGCLIIILVLSLGIFSISCLAHENFLFILFSVIVDTLFGLVTVLMYLKLKLTSDASSQTMIRHHSLRKSVVNKHLSHITNGYRPKKRPKPVDVDDNNKFGGIYMGDDDENDESINEFDEFEYSQCSMTNVTTTSVEGLNLHPSFNDFEL